MNGNGQHIGAFVKNILCAVAMVIINIQHCHFSILAQILGGNGRLK